MSFVRASFCPRADLPSEAKVELGEQVASKLKLSEDGTKVCILKITHENDLSMSPTRSCGPNPPILPTILRTGLVARRIYIF